MAPPTERTTSFLCRLQGLQRRVIVNIVHESRADVEWKDVCELVVGKRWVPSLQINNSHFELAHCANGLFLGYLRTSPHTDETITDPNIISLNVLAAGYVRPMQDDW